MSSIARFRTAIQLAMLANAIATVAMCQSAPVILFTDLVSGPATGNSDNSQPGQLAGQDGAIVTVWGKYLGTSPGMITVGGQPARIYSWGNATGPADLYTRHKMQMVSFQIPHGVPNGATTIQATVGGQTSNTLPFTVRAGNIYFVSTIGNDSAAGTWSTPWQHLYNQTQNMQPGDTVYLLNGYTQTGAHDGGACSSPGCTMGLEYHESSSQFATQALPKAVVAYPGATVSIGDTSVDAWGIYIADNSPSAAYWTFSKLTLIGNSGAAGYSMGHRLIGNHISCPNGDGQTGCIGGDDSTNLYVLGNELTNIGYAGTSKLYHPMYIQSMESGTAPRLPDENNREIGWNYLHDNYAYDGINLYRENTYSAFMLNTRVHDNFIVNQTGRGILIGSYVVGPDNYFYNNVIIRAGKGPDSKYTSDPAFNYQCVYFGAGWSAYPGTTTIHFYNNTLYDCGWNDPGNPSSDNVMIAYDPTYPFTLDFRNNIVLATSWPYDDGGIPTGSGAKNVWYGQGAHPAWDPTGISANPLLVNPIPPTADAHLQSGSPAIGAGSTAGPSVAIDFDNLLRPSPPSIGAFEFSSATAPPPDNTAPSVPAGLSATAASPSQVNLSWTASVDPDNSASQIAYTVYRNGAQIANTAPGSTTYSDSGLAAATSYVYTVDAFDPAVNTSAQSSPVTVMTTAAPVPVISSFTASPSSITAGASSTLSWSVTSATTLSVSGIGTVTGTSISVSPVQTTIYTLTATNSAGSATARTTVTVTVTPAASITISISPSTVTLGQGQQQPFAVTVTGTSNTAVTWSFNPAVGTLSPSGVYTAPATISGAQTVTVKATSVADSTKSASATVTLQPPTTPTPAVSITLTPGSVTLGQGQQQPFTATVTGTSNTAVTWSFNPAIGLLSSTGVYTAPAAVSSTLTITVKATSVADPSKSASATLTLQPPTKGVSITVIPPLVSLRAGRRRQFRAIVRGSSDREVTWSLTPAVGKISATGVYTAPAAMDSDQTVTITATSKANSTKSGQAIVNLISPNTLQISNFGAFHITANSATVTWDTNVATSGQVQYGTTTAYGRSIRFPVQQWSHTLTLTGLSPGTVYHYQIQAWTDLASGVSSTMDLTFTTVDQ